jgi:hypothetical protein
MVATTGQNGLGREELSNSDSANALGMREGKPCVNFLIVLPIVSDEYPLDTGKFGS